MVQINIPKFQSCGTIVDTSSRQFMTCLAFWRKRLSTVTPCATSILATTMPGQRFKCSFRTILQRKCVLLVRMIGRSWMRSLGIVNSPLRTSVITLRFIDVMFGVNETLVQQILYRQLLCRGFSKTELRKCIEEDRKILEEQEALYGMGDSRRLYSACLDRLECDIDVFLVCFEHHSGIVALR